jgi:hypothetical protein
MPNIYAVDFDGTLSRAGFPECGYPNMRLINALKWRMEIQKRYPPEERDIFVLWTCRQGQPLEAAVTWLETLGLVFDGINELPSGARGVSGFPDEGRKIDADFYIDDRAMTPDRFLVLMGR